MNIRFLLFLSFVALLGSSCEDPVSTKVYESQALLYGLDLTLTPCSGGIVTKIGEEVQDYRIESLPAGFEIDYSTAEFPMEVEIDWTLNRHCSTNAIIDVDAINVIE